MIFLNPLSHNAQKIRFFRLFLHFLYYSSRTHVRFGERFRSALADTLLRIAVHLRSTSVGSEQRSPGSYSPSRSIFDGNFLQEFIDKSILSR